jgi:plastocyanin
MKPILLVVISFLMLGAQTNESPNAEVHIVRIEGMKFIPKSLEVKVGETVVWVNQTESSHNVMANDGSFKSEMLHKSGEKFKFTFKKVGEFSYHCEPHRMMGMKGKVIVKNAP